MTDNFDKEIENDGCTIPSISPTEEIETSNDIGDVTVDIEEPTKEPDKENEEAAILKRYNLEKEAIDKKNEELKEREAEMAKEIVREREIRDNMVLGDNPVSPERAEADADAIYSMGEDLEEKRVELLKLEEEEEKNESRREGHCCNCESCRNH